MFNLQDIIRYAQQELGPNWAVDVVVMAFGFFLLVRWGLSKPKPTSSSPWRDELERNYYDGGY